MRASSSFSAKLSTVPDFKWTSGPPSSSFDIFIPNALLLPHVGYVTAENYSIFYTQMIENLEACVAGKPIREIK